MALTKGLRLEPQRIVIYGPEGIGKSTLASMLPDPVFIDIEGSTSDLDVVRETPTPSSWRALLDLTNSYVSNHQGCQTLVIDTADWAERLAINHVCAANNITSLGGNNDFGKSYSLLDTEWARWLDLLSRVANSGMHVCLTAHAKMRLFAVPDQDESYDRWELKLEKKTSATLREWARTVLFLNYKTYVVEGEKKSDKAKGRGGKRVIYTSHHPCWDAKNRAGLPDEMPLGYDGIKGLFSFSENAIVEPQPVAIAEPRANLPPVEHPPVASAPAHLVPLYDLMRRDGAELSELQAAVAARGYYPVDTPPENYDPQFVAGKLVAHWPAVFGLITKQRHEQQS